MILSAATSSPAPRVVGGEALLLELGSTHAVSAWHSELVRRRAAGEFAAAELVPAARTVLVDGVADPAGLAARLREWPLVESSVPVAGPVVEVPTVYDGPDLAEVAALWGVPVDEVVARHVATEFEVAFCGFAPGFGYLTGLPERWRVPRRAEPRPKVPTGSVGLAGPYTGVYPSESPGGWQLIGRTDLVLFDPEREPPALLSPGTRVRFVARRAV
ncbi:MAG: 5-oxoprolinase subunit PxpB, partial [Micromonosporaceae bacterium]